MKEETAVKERIYGLIDRMSKRIGLNISRREYPSIRISQDERSNYEETGGTITLNSKDLNSGTMIGEEIGHYLRVKTRKLTFKEPPSKLKYYLRHPFGNELDRVPSNPEYDHIHTSEFFGYIGRRILQEVATKQDSLNFVQSKRDPKEFPRESRLTHQRPYTFAASVDLSQVQDYKAFFSLPDRVVRSRFFRSDPQYDLSKPIQEAKITKRNQQTKRPREKLEALVKIIAPIFLLIAIILLSQKTITGNAINNLNFTGTVPIVVILIIALVFVVAAGIKRKR
jgi:hypothetical protein